MDNRDCPRRGRPLEPPDRDGRRGAAAAVAVPLRAALGQGAVR